VRKERVVDGASCKLREMDRAYGSGRDLVVEVAKALTLAEEFPETEARISCQTMADALEAHRMLRGRHAQDLRLVPHDRRRWYELPRGGVVSVAWCGGSTWPVKGSLDVRPFEKKEDRDV
jgi:hypothetical protein